MKVWWLIHKDLLSECRARQVWPAMLLLGIVVVLVLAIQLDLPAEQKERVVGGLLWVAVFFAGILGLDRSFGIEREQGCLQGLMLYAVPPAQVYLAKLAVNVLALACVECLLIPLFCVLTNTRLLVHPWAILLVALLGNLAMAAVGTLLSAAMFCLRQRGHLLALLVLPVVLPALLGEAEATRWMIAGNFGAQWWRWIQLLAAFAVIFITAGIVLFEFVVED